jgi:hypothetical protein
MGVDAPGKPGGQSLNWGSVVEVSVIEVITDHYTILLMLSE